jgi:pectate lyase
MKKFSTLTAMLLMLCSILPIVAAEKIVAFPGAEGYGCYATGGRGGKTYVVTSLEDCEENNLKEGTFRWAVKQPGKKIITFAVNGTIYLKSPLCMDSGDLTILGQTAPGEGICLADYPVTISCENAIIRYIRIRLGNRQVAYHEGDGFGIEGGNNIIIDHCSFSWSIDECLSISEGTNITIQWCMIEQALNNAGHSKGAHGYGGNWGGTNVSYHHNLIAQCTSRVPRMGGDTDPFTRDFVDIRNNVYYNWGGEGCYGAEDTEANIVNNYYKPGPCTDTRSIARRKRIVAIGIRTNSYIKSFPAFAPSLHKWGHFYIDGNTNSDYAEVTADNWTNGVYNQIDAAGSDGTYTATTKDTIRLRTPREFMSVTTHTADQTYEKVLEYAGASLYRDCVDQLIVEQVRNRLGEENSGSNGAKWGQIDKQSDNGFTAKEVEYGAWPILKNIAPAAADTDGDGIPDVQEENWNLDASNPYDGAKLYSGPSAAYIGYAYVEVYVNNRKSTIRNWNALCTADGTPEGVSEPTIIAARRMNWEHEISALTFKGYDPATKRQLFADDLSVDATGGISGGTGQNGTLKLRAQKYTLHVPATIKATKLRIYGYSNYSGTDIHIAECNGKNYGARDYVISAETGTWSDITIPFDAPVSDKELTVTFSGNAPTVKMYLIDDSEEATTAIQEVERTYINKNDRYYDLNGRPSSHPSRGIYILNNKKIFIR